MNTLSTLTLSGTIYVASDIHLGPSIPHTNKSFFNFLQQAQQQADHLILAGDIFNVWFGDDLALASNEPWLQEALSALRHCASQIPTYIIHGNRDFLIGEQLCTQLGITLLPEQCLLQTDAGVVFISHGDELCTHDKGYMRLRHVLRYKPLQKVFLAMPISWRRGIANFLRRQSKSAQQAQDAQYHRDYDINPEAVNQLILSYPQIDYIVHGHTHKPAVHIIKNADGKMRQRYVLSDWDIEGNPSRKGYLTIDKTLHLVNN